MLTGHDQISQPSKDRYFPIPHTTMRKLLRETAFSPPITANRFVLNYENDLRSYDEGHGLGTFEPPNYFRLNSFAVEVDLVFAERITLLMLEIFHDYDRDHRPPKPSPKHVTTVANYCDVYLDPTQQKLAVVERIMHRTKARFRATAKVRHAYKTPWRTMKRSVIKELAL